MPILKNDDKVQELIAIALEKEKAKKEHPTIKKPKRPSSGIKPVNTKSGTYAAIQKRKAAHESQITHIIESASDKSTIYRSTRSTKVSPILKYVIDRKGEATLEEIQLATSYSMNTASLINELERLGIEGIRYNDGVIRYRKK